MVVSCASLGESKGRIAVAHAKLRDADTAEEMNAWWRERLTALKLLLDEASVQR